MEFHEHQEMENEENRQHSKRVKKKSITRGRKANDEQKDKEELQILKSLDHKIKPESTSKDNFAIFEDCITSKLCKIGDTLTEDETDSVEFEIFSVTEKARKSRNKQNQFSNYSFLCSTAVLQRTPTYLNILSNLANGLGSPHFNPSS